MVVRDGCAHAIVARRARGFRAPHAKLDNQVRIGHPWTLKICNAGRTSFGSESSWYGVIFDVARSRETIASLEAKTSHPDFWKDQEQAQRILQQRKVAEEVLAADTKLARTLSDVDTY